MSISGRVYVSLTASDLVGVPKFSGEGLQDESVTFSLDQYEATAITVLTNQGVPEQVYDQYLVPS